MSSPVSGFEVALELTRGHDFPVTAVGISWSQDELHAASSPESGELAVLVEVEREHVSFEALVVPLDRIRRQPHDQCPSFTGADPLEILAAGTEQHLEPVGQKPFHARL